MLPQDDLLGHWSRPVADQKERLWQVQRGRDQDGRHHHPHPRPDQPGKVPEAICKDNKAKGNMPYKLM